MLNNNALKSHINESITPQQILPAQGVENPLFLSHQLNSSSTNQLKASSINEKKIQ
jgi:hypothetical protein